MDKMTPSYDVPQVWDIGTLEDLTLMPGKSGSTADSPYSCEDKPVFT
jgi:hypothetical protein